MSITNIFEFTVAIVLASGATSAFVYALLKLVGSTISKSFIEKFKSELQVNLESHKANLRKSEFLFQKEYEATSEFVAMKRGLLPPYRFPDMDWHEACEEIAQNFGRNEQKLIDFIAKHGAILDKKSLHNLTKAEGIAAENKFDSNVPEPPTTAINAADDFWKILGETEDHLKNKLSPQSAA